MATIPAEVHGPSDADLIASVRGGSTQAYGELYQRHVAAAYNLARQLAHSPAEADDLVSDAFAKVLDTLRAGKGPDSAFRAYLLTALRHGAYDKTRKDRKVALTDDVTEAGADIEKISVPFSDTAVAGLDRSLAAQAYARLPERWQMVLWHTEVEGQSAAAVAPLLGISANGVSALAYRAREGLRQEYLQVHLAQTAAARCRATVDRLGAWTRGGLSKRETVQVEAHLDECERCRALAAELADVNGALRLVLAPLVLGGGAAGYLATTAGTVTPVAGGTAAAAGSAGGAAGAAASAPRQFLGVAGSAAALAAAIVAASVMNTSSQVVPAAEAAQPPSASAPAQPPASHQPPPPGSNPPSHPPTPGSQGPTATSTPASHPAPPPTSASHPAPPGMPTLHTDAPSVTLTPGGPPVRLPLTVRNTGNAPSGPVTATLHLPAGVSAVGSSGRHFAGSRLIALDASGAGSGSHVQCPSGTGTVRCSSTTGLQPGQSVTLVYRLRASESARSGTVTGSVTSSKGSVHVGVRIPVQVTQRETPPPAPPPTSSPTQPPPPPPPQRDAISLDVEGGRRPWFTVRVTDAGDTSGRVILTIDARAMPHHPSQPLSCESSDRRTVCRTITKLAPDESVRVAFHVAPGRICPQGNHRGGRALAVWAKLRQAGQGPEYATIKQCQDMRW